MVLSSCFIKMTPINGLQVFWIFVDGNWHTQIAEIIIFIRNCTLQRAILDKDFGYIFIMFVLQYGGKKRNVLFAHILLL